MDGPAAVTIRKARVEEAEKICACLRAAFAPYRAAYTTEAFADTVPSVAGVAARFGSMDLLVADRGDGDVVGTIACSGEGDHGHLRGMAVLTEMQGQDVAARLLAAAEDALRGRGCRRVTLDTTAPLRRAIRFYEKQGYRQTGVIGDFYGMPLYEFAKTLEGYVSGLQPSGCLSTIT